MDCYQSDLHKMKYLTTMTNQAFFYMPKNKIITIIIIIIIIIIEII